MNEYKLRQQATQELDDVQQPFIREHYAETSLMGDNPSPQKRESIEETWEKIACFNKKRK